MVLMNQQEKAQFDELKSRFDDWEQVNIARVEGGYLISVTHRYVGDDNVVQAVVTDQIVASTPHSIPDIVDGIFNRPKKVQAVQ